MTRKQVAWVSASAAVLAGLMGAGGFGRAQRVASRAWKAPDIYYPRPLQFAVQSLESHFARPVTYEDPVWAYSGDVERLDGDPRNELVPRWRQLRLAGLPALDGATKLDVQLVERVIAAYVQQNGAPTFRVASSSYGLHIIPTASRDGGGRLRPETALLDTTISITEGPHDPIEEICKSVSAATGTRVFPSLRPIGNGFFRFYTGGRAFPRKWGAENVSARAALISVLEKSATTFTWRLLCGPHENPRERFCVLGIVPLEVTVRDRSGRETKRFLEYDRCTGCPVGFPPLPPPPR